MQRVPALATRAFGAAPPAPAPGSPAPSVFEKLISLTVVDPSGARKKIPAFIGELFLVLPLLFAM